MAIRRKNVVEAERAADAKAAEPEKRRRAARGARAAAQAPGLQPAHVQQDEGIVMARLCKYAEGVKTEETITEHRVPSPKFAGEVARTRVAMGLTKSLGGFEFARLDIMVELPCNPNPQDLEETNLFAAQKVSEYMERELASILPPELPHIDRTVDMSALLESETNGDN